MEVTAVIPNWNGEERLAKVLRDLKEQTLSLAAIIVVDNGSQDGSVQVASQAGAQVLQLDRNHGFAAAVNRGVSEARTRWITILNNDLELPPAWLAQLGGSLADGIPFVAGKLLRLSDPGRIDGCYDAICRGGCAWRCGQGRQDGAVWSSPREIAFAPFTAVLMRRDFYLEIGGLDEVLGTYLEDVEFGLRCASKGYTGLYAPEAIAYHAGNSTLGRWSHATVRQISRNQVLIVARHYPTSLLIRFGWPIAVAQLLWGLVALKHGAGLAWVLGKADGIRMFASYRRGKSAAAVAAVLGSSEKDIRELQNLTGWDWYWRIYFALT